MDQIKTESKRARPEFPNHINNRLFISSEISSMNYMQVYMQTCLPPSSILHCSARTHYRKDQRASIRPSASRSNHDQVHETTIAYAKYDSNHWKQEAIASGTKTHNCWNPL